MENETSSLHTIRKQKPTSFAELLERFKKYIKQEELEVVFKYWDSRGAKKSIKKMMEREWKWSPLKHHGN